MSKTLKYDVITYTPYEGLNYTILDQIKPLWRRIGELPGFRIGCYRGDPGQQRHSGSYDQGRNEEGKGGRNSPGDESIWGAEKSQKCYK